MMDIQVARGLSKVTPKVAADGRRLVAAWFTASELMEAGNCNNDDGGAVRKAYVNFALKVEKMDDTGKTLLQTAAMLAASGSELSNEFAVKTKIVYATSLALRRMLGTMALSNGCLVMAEEQYVKAATLYPSDVPGYDPAADMRRVSEARLMASSAK
jgi:hypothetical protein